MRTEPKEILVLGDWVVDDYWVVSEHRAKGASRVGGAFSRALHGPTGSVQALCGAGQVASILVQCGSETDQPTFFVHGIGSWDDYDRTIIQGMLDPIYTQKRTPHQMAFKGSTGGNLLINSRLHNLQSPDRRGTTRVFRIYRHTKADQIVLEQRIDWDWEPESADSSRDLPKIKGNIGHIIIKDLDKGAVTRLRVDELKKRYPNAKWYVSSKVWDPEWISVIPKDKLQLLFVPLRAALDAVRTKSLEPDWVSSPKGVPSLQTLSWIGDSSSKFVNADIIVQASKEHILATCRRDGSVLGTVMEIDLKIQLELVPMASILFPALIAQAIANSDSDFEDRLPRVISFTKEWVSGEMKRLTKESWTSSRRDALSESDLSTDIRLKDWVAMKEDWSNAFKGVGTIETNGTQPKEFQLWRAMSVFDEYVSCSASKTRQLSDLLTACQQFLEAQVKDRRHSSFMLIDDPGSGKSFLVECLAKKLGIKHLEFNLTQMGSRRELLECFRSISAFQSESSTMPIIAFFDEINAKVDGKHIYDAFLDPMEKGSFMHEGKLFHLRPLIWLFAGTENPGRSSASDKGPDLESRLLLSPMHLTHAEEANGLDPHPYLESQCVERVYVGVATMLSVFPEVTSVSEKVLQAFRRLPPELGPRGIKRLIKGFQYVQRGKITYRNFPDKWFLKERLGANIAHNDLQDILKFPDEIMIDIKTRPSDSVWRSPTQFTEKEEELRRSRTDVKKRILKA